MRTKADYLADKTYNIRDDNDFPNRPIGNEIELNEGIYVFKRGYTTQNSLKLVGENVRLIYQNIEPITFSGSNGYFTGEFAPTDIERINVIIEGASASFLALSASINPLSSLNLKSPTVSFQNGATCGGIINGAFIINDFVFSGMLDSINLVDCLSSITNGFINQSTSSTLSVFNISGTLPCKIEDVDMDAQNPLFLIQNGYVGNARLSDINSLNVLAPVFDGSGLDQKSVYVTTFNCATAADSRNISFLIVSGNTTPVTLTNNVWADLDFTSSPAIAGSSTELWQISDPITGEVEYIGEENFNGEAINSITYEPSGGGLAGINYEFRLLKNGNTLPENQIFASSTTGGDSDALTPVVPITASTGDKFRWQPRRLNNTRDLIVTAMSWANS